MNVAITGSNGVGKTTLYKEMIKKFPDTFTYFHETPEDEKVEPESFFGYMYSQEKILKEQTRQLEWAKTHKLNILSDGSLIDNFVHMVMGKKSPYTYALSRDAKSSRDIIEVLSPIVCEAIAHFYDYDLLFYIPIEFKRDNISKEEILHQWTIDNLIKHILDVYGIKHHIVHGSVEERKDFVIRMITDFELRNQ